MSVRYCFDNPLVFITNNSGNLKNILTYYMKTLHEDTKDPKSIPKQVMYNLQKVMLEIIIL